MVQSEREGGQGASYKPEPTEVIALSAEDPNETRI